MSNQYQKYLAEMIGTMVLVLVGCGAIVMGGFGPAFPVGILPVALAFGLAVMAMAYSLGPVSGCHINPAVTAAMWGAGRIPTDEAIGYVVAQFIGGIVGAGLLALIMQGRLQGYDVGASGLGQNGWGQGYLGGYGLGSAMLVEFLATLIFTLVILALTNPTSTTAVAGLAIGLTLVALHFPFIMVTGLSVNPARSLGPALFVGGKAIAQVWMFVLVPTVAGLVAGLIFRTKFLDQ